MSYLSVKYDEYETKQICDALQDLHVLQDRPVTEWKKALIAKEMEEAGMPFKAVIMGIKALHSVELRSIKLTTIKESVWRFVDRDASNIDNGCDYCRGEGSVFLKDTENRSFALACICGEGEKIALSQKLVRWNGQEQISSNNRILSR